MTDHERRAIEQEVAELRRAIFDIAKEVRLILERMAAERSRDLAITTILASLCARAGTPDALLRQWLAAIDADDDGATDAAVRAISKSLKR